MSPLDVPPIIAAETRLQTRDGLVVEASCEPASTVLQTFYVGYDQAFVLPNEKETLAGFAECLALNQGERYAELSALYGVFRELVMVAHAPDGEMLGGANFIAHPVTDGRLCVNLNYVYILPAQRRKGQFKALIRAVQEVALAQFAGPGQAQLTAHTPLLFIEQNDPLRMSREEYARDTEYTGLDQVDRLSIWARLGARIVDFAYVQPALSETQAADANLVYSVLGADGSSLAACVLRDHLERFFAISVLKGNGLQSSPEASAQIAALTLACQRRESVELLEPGPALQQLRGASAPRIALDGVSNLRELARACASSHVHGE